MCFFLYVGVDIHADSHGSIITPFISVSYKKRLITQDASKQLARDRLLRQRSVIRSRTNLAFSNQRSYQLNIS